ncbi:craniofacial development protein 2-like [Penaeus japonicus]|uniref:craniofacial development protein 2-like n=1 Tax=Penaeus japonicus TaxID=27405 RepID=UPI001C70DAB4|nr:craniofacial development protein 2-like [Penaeus japonicus]
MQNEAKKTKPEQRQLENLKQEFQILGLDILGVCETRWTGNGRFTSDDIIMLYSGGQDHSNGGGIILKQDTAKSLISDRVMAIKLRATPVDMNIIQAYAPASASTNDEINTFYEQLGQAMTICKST